MENAFFPRLAWDTSQLFRKSLTSLRALTLLLVMCLSIGNVWGATYNLYTQSSITAGDYIIVGYQSSSKKYYAMNNTCTSNQYMGITEVSPSNDAISESGTAIVWSISASTNGFYIKNGSNYLDDNATSNKNYVQTTATAATTSEWTFAYNSTNKIWTITNYGTSTTKKTLSFNIGSTRVACYASVQSGNTCCYLYKKASSSSAADPSLTSACNFSTATFDVTITNNESGATVYYTTDGNDPTTSTETSFTGESKTIQISATTTVKAMAVVSGKDNSSVVSATYTKLEPLTTMDAILAAATTAGSSATDVAVTFNNWVISGISTGSTSKNAYLTDGTKGLIIYNNSGHGFAVGDQLSGTVSCKVQLYQGSAELTSLTSSTTGLTIASGKSVTPQVKTITELGAINTGSVVTIKKLTYSSSSSTLSDGTNTIKPYNQLYSSMSFTDGTAYDVTGVFVYYNGNPKEIAPRSASDIAEAACESEVAITKAATEHGSFEVSSDLVCADAPGGFITVTPSPDDNYSVGEVTATVGSVGTPTSGVYPVTGITAASEIAVTFVENAHANITWSFKGESLAGGTSKH